MGPRVIALQNEWPYFLRREADEALGVRFVASGLEDDSVGTGVDQALYGLGDRTGVARDSQVGDLVEAGDGLFGLEAGDGVRPGGGEEIDDDAVRVGTTGRRAALVDEPARLAYRLGRVGLAEQRAVGGLMRPGAGSGGR